MIARIWRATATTEGAHRYRDHFTTAVLPHLREVKGFLGASLLEREAAGVTEIQVITRWESLRHIHDFAGDDLTTAVVEPAALAVLEHADDVVTHHEVVVEA